jgi:hypothetical protein
MPDNLDSDNDNLLGKIFSDSLVYCKNLGAKADNSKLYSYNNFELWTIDGNFCSLAFYERNVKQKYAQIINGSFFKRTYLSSDKKTNILVFDYHKTSFRVL